MRKNRNFAIQASNSENGQKTGSNITAILPVTFKEKLLCSCKRFGRLQMLHWSFFVCIIYDTLIFDYFNDSKTKHIKSSSKTYK